MLRTNYRSVSTFLQASFAAAVICGASWAEQDPVIEVPEDQDDLMAFLNSPDNPLRKAPLLFGDGNYLAPIRFLATVDASGTMLEDPLNQITAQWLSMVGDERGAEKTFGAAFGLTGEVAPEGSIAAFQSEFEVTDAIAVVIERAEKTRVVMVNEAHHVPQTRMLTTGLLQPLYDRGFRYLALEALGHEVVADFKEAGRPVQGTGGYLSEPVFADMVRSAQEIGFTLVAYEAQEMHFGEEMNGAIGREKEQAANLAEILERDPDARVLVHCGYEHLNESNTNGFKYMAELLSEMTSIDPLTVDQTRMRGRWQRSLEDPFYTAIAEELRMPSVLLNGEGEAWVAPSQIGKHDLTVFLPRPKFDGQRSDWLDWYGRRRSIEVERSLFDSQAEQTLGLMQAFAISSREPGLAGKVPVDQFVMTDAAGPWTLHLPAGSYLLRVVDDNGEVIPGCEANLRVGD